MAHSHNHGHEHGTSNYSRAFAIGIALNLGFVIVEATYGILAHSVALLADAGHNSSDVLSLVLALGSQRVVSSSTDPSLHLRAVRFLYPGLAA